MKKILHKLFLGAAALVLGTALFSGCANNLEEKKDVSPVSREATTVTLENLNRSVKVTIYLYGVPSTNTTPGVWAWEKVPTGDVNLCGSSWPGTETMTKGTYEGYEGYTYELAIDPEYDLGILFNKIPGGAPQTSDIVIPKEDVSSDVTYYFNWNSMAYYTDVDDCIGLMGGSITALNKDAGTAIVTCTTSLLPAGTITSGLTVKDSTGTELTIESAVIKNNVLTIAVKNGTDSNVSKIPYSVTYGSKTKTATVSTSLIEKLYGTAAASGAYALGLTLSGSSATFNCWAPTASDVKVLLYTSVDDIGNFKPATVAARSSGSCDEAELRGNPSTVQNMNFDGDTGIWSVTTTIVTYKYYKYQIKIGDTTYYVADIWNGVAAPDSIASQIVDINDTTATPADWESNYTNPFGNTGSETKKYNDAVIYEMHVRDWSRAVVTDSTGKFLDIANSEAIMKHLKDLGVTHVQLLPVFDYAQVNADENYNWGYNPYHYNVPEGRYVTAGYKEGTQAVKEMRQMIKAFHDNGIAVIMDVVYNHTSGTKGGSLYDSTVPGYFYSLDASGNYYSGSGCGNNLDTRHAVVRKYVIDSLVHWVNDYHINGFRFDLMGCLDQATMKKVYDTLYEIDKNILVYGEPWTGGSTGMNGSSEETKTALKGAVGYGVGAFDDDYRDAIKGGEFGGFGTGQIQGSFNSNIENGLAGEEIVKNKRNSTGISGLAIHYAECHDNFTLFDKLIYSTLTPLPSGDKYASKFAAAYNAVMNDEAKLSVIKKQQMLAGAYVILGQGTPFLNGGQEFMRTKKGDPDSYAPDTKGGIKWTSRYNGGSYVKATDIDDVNTIDLTMKDTYTDVYTTYKMLIALRKAYKAFTDPTSVSAVSLASGVTKYDVSASDGNFTVIFNASDKIFRLPSSSQPTGKLVSTYEVTGTYAGFAVNDTAVGNTSAGFVLSASRTIKSVPAYSFVIVKTE